MFSKRLSGTRRAKWGWELWEVLIVQSVRDVKINIFLQVPCCSWGFAFRNPRSNSDHLLPVTTVLHKHGDRNPGPLLWPVCWNNPQAESWKGNCKIWAENESWSLKPSPMFWYQSAVYAQFYYFDGFSVLKKKLWICQLFLLYIIVK